MNSNVLGRQWYPVPSPAETHQSSGDNSLTTLTRTGTSKTWNLLHETPDTEHESAIRARSAKSAQRKASRRISRL